MHCAACNTNVSLAAGERIGFRDECEQCRADLHSCRNCAHHDPSAYNECRESQSERVLDRERANRCDYFRPSERTGGSDSFRPSERAGESADPRTEALSQLDSLFKK